MSSSSAHVCRRRMLLAACAALICVAAFVTTGATARALTVERATGSVDVIGGIVASPARIEQVVRPGATYHFDLSFQNAFGKPVNVTFQARDLSSGSRGNQPDFVPVEAGLYGAGDWVTLDGDHAQLQHGDTARLTATVHVPATISPGSYYAAVTGTGGAGSVTGTGAVINTQVGIELFFTVPGDEDFAGRIEATYSPWFVQSTPGFDCLPGIQCRSFLPIEIEYHNLGNQTDLVHGEVRMAALGGRTADRLKLDQLVLLRGSRREFTTAWHDPPWIGRFVPHVELVSRSGKKVTVKLEPIWIVPAWYYWVVFAIALGLPIAWRIRSRRRWKRLEAEVAEWRSRADQTDDDDESSW